MTFICKLVVCLLFTLPLNLNILFSAALVTPPLSKRLSETMMHSKWENLSPFQFEPNRSVPPMPHYKPDTQWFKDLDYQRAIYNAWIEEIDNMSTIAPLEIETSQVEYYDDQGTPLYGTIVQRKQDEDLYSREVPGILFFHTGAGPRDIFLLWKAYSLLQAVDVLPYGGVVLICDILSDPNGWAWNPNRDRYNQVRDQLLEMRDEKGQHPLLLSRVQAAYQTLSTVSNVDSDRMAALGWCLGGHPILQLAQCSDLPFKAMITFHGVFDSVPVKHQQSASLDSTDDLQDDLTPKTGTPILICNGLQDPFVKPYHLQSAIRCFQEYGYNVRVLSFPNVKHGFTNPAQDFHENHAAFAFEKNAAATSWHETLQLLKIYL